MQLINLCLRFWGGSERDAWLAIFSCFHNDKALFRIAGIWLVSVDVRGALVCCPQLTCKSFNEAGGSTLELAKECFLKAA
jgi:hypothetical protein